MIKKKLYLKFISKPIFEQFLTMELESFRTVFLSHDIPSSKFHKLKFIFNDFVIECKVGEKKLD